jgi:hypothetical protein
LFKGKLQQQSPEPNQPFKAVDDIFSSLSVDLMEDVFRLVHFIASDGDYVE